MKAFTRFESVDHVLAWLDRQIGAVAPCTLPVAQSCGRILVEPARAVMDLPPFHSAAVDGYALQSVDTMGAGGYSPIPLTLRDEAHADDPIPSRSAVRVCAGAPLPRGADAVLPQQYAEASSGRVEIERAAAPGENILRQGSDAASGSELLPASRRLRPQDLALFAACGVERVAVAGRPKVRILLAGSDLVSPGSPRAFHQHLEADSLLLTTLVERDGGQLETCLSVGADCAALAKALTDVACDMILVAGGSGEGWRDEAAAALAEAGEVVFHGIALDPARSTGAGRAGKSLILLLPGEPVACLCAYDVFAGRTLRRLAGLGTAWPHGKKRMVLTKKIASELGGVDYCRVKFTPEGAEPVARGANVSLAALATADGFVLVPESCEGYPRGAEVTVYPYDPVSMAAVSSDRPPAE